MNLNIHFGPWPEFFQELAAPKSGDELQKRLKSNLTHWTWNYVAVAAVFVLLASYFYPGLFVVIVIVGATFGVFLFLKDTPLQVGGTKITQTHKHAALALETLVGLYFSETFTPLLWSLAVGGVVAIIHAGLKHESLLSKTKAAVKKGVVDLKEDLKDEYKKLE